MKFTRVWLPLNALRAFEAVARTLNFTKAAEVLGVTQSAVSRQVQRLESLLGVALLDRKKTGIVLTSDGERLREATSESFDNLERILRDVVEGEKHGALRLSVATSFAHCFGPKLFVQFSKQFPQIGLEVHSLGNETDLSESACDLAIIYSKPRVTRHLMNLLWNEELTPVCSPLLVQSQPSSVSAFIREQVLLHTQTESGRYFAWEQWARSCGTDPSETHKGVVFDSSILAVQYALEGEGVAMVDKRLYAREIEEGRLCAPFEQHCESGFGYYCVVRADDANDERLQVFRNWVIERFEAQR